MICREGAFGGSAAMLENARPGTAYQRALHGDVTPRLPRTDRALLALLRLQGAAPLQAHPARRQEDYSRSVSLHHTGFTPSETCSSVHIQFYSCKQIVTNHIFCMAVIIYVDIYVVRNNMYI